MRGSLTLIIHHSSFIIYVKRRSPRGEFDFGLRVGVEAFGRRGLRSVAAVFNVARPERETPTAFGH